MTFSTIQTPMLRYIAIYYGNFGIQLQKYSRNNFSSQLNLLQNVSINLIVFYTMYWMDIFKVGQYQAHMDESKPLFGLLFRLTIRNTFPLVNFIGKLHYYFYGASIIKLLDSVCMQKVYNKYNDKAIGLVLGFIIFNSVGYVALHIDRTKDLFLDHDHLYFNIFTNLCVFALNIGRYFPCVALHYFQYGTFENLKVIKQKLKSKAQNIERECIRNFSELALLNQQFHNVISFHLILFLSMSSINALITIYVWLFFLKNHVFIIYPMISVTYLLFLAHLNGKIEKISDKIASILRKRHETVENRNAATRINKIEVIASHQFLRHYAQNNHRHMSEETKRSCQIKLYELDIYVKYFEMRIFHIARVNKAFLLGTALLIANYIIFIYQTK